MSGLAGLLGSTSFAAQAGAQAAQQQPQPIPQPGDGIRDIETEPGQFWQNLPGIVQGASSSVSSIWDLFDPSRQAQRQPNQTFVSQEANLTPVWIALGVIVALVLVLFFVLKK